jgi:hypothetical protein
MNPQEMWLGTLGLAALVAQGRGDDGLAGVAAGAGACDGDQRNWRAGTVSVHPPS